MQPIFESHSEARVSGTERRVVFLILYLCVSVFICGLTSSSAQERVDLLISGGTVVTMDAQRGVIEDGAVAVRREAILAVGKREALEAGTTAARRIEARGKLVMPGLINGHTHAAMSLFRGIADDMNLQDWLTKFIFPAEKKNVSAEFVRWGTRLACLEMLLGGTTTYTDMYYFEDTVATATREAGMRGVLGETVIGFPVSDAATPAD